MRLIRANSCDSWQKTKCQTRNPAGHGVHYGLQMLTLQLTTGQFLLNLLPIHGKAFMSTVPEYQPHYTVEDYQHWDGDWEI